MKDPYNILQYPLVGLKILARHPIQNSILNKLSNTFYLSSLLYLFVITLFQYRNIEGDVYKLANNLEGSTAYIQTSGKVIFTITHRDKILELLGDIKLFWNFEKCNETVKNQLENILKRTSNILQVFFVCIIATEALIAMAPIFTKDIAVGAWTMESHGVLFKITLVLQEAFLLFVFTTFNFILDCLFLVLFIYLIVQYKILNYCFKNLRILNDSNEIDARRYSEALQEYIQYHVFLLRYSKKLRDTAAPVMLIEYVTTAVLFCTEMYMFIESNSLQESIRRPVSFCAVLFQLGFYCIPADYVTSEALAVSDSIYESNWMSEYLPSTRKMIPFIIQRAQLPISFSAGGLISINSRTLINVVKISWSICTILRVLKNK